MSTHRNKRIPRIAARVCENLQRRSRLFAQTDFLWQLLNEMPEIQRASARHKISPRTDAGQPPKSIHVVNWRYA
ncbi:MAG: hypothetical protein DHS20C16_22450 [Phycisphaerae bacterium]|nr:MAG: hypothetical protein DHS20C16_22450 [Phycisphaerae bacterium]